MVNRNQDEKKKYYKMFGINTLKTVEFLLQVSSRKKICYKNVDILFFSTYFQFLQFDAAFEDELMEKFFFMN